MNEVAGQIPIPLRQVKPKPWSRIVDLSGKTFGRLIVLGRAPDYVSPKGQACTAWFTQCSCGADPKPVNARALKIGQVISCGCAAREKIRDAVTIHGMSHTVEHRAWIAMHRRCTDEKEKSFKDYGGRGIQVCERWAAFLPFFEDMGKCPAGLSIERNDVNGNYEPKNCRWATATEQARNTRRNHRLQIGTENLCIIEWAERTTIRHETIRSRIERGWSPERAVFSPLDPRGHKK